MDAGAVERHVEARLTEGSTRGIQGSLDLFLADPDTRAAHFGGGPLNAKCRTIAVGPEGGWSPAELERAGSHTVSLGPTVLRTETAAIAAATLLCAHRSGVDSHPS